MSSLGFLSIHVGEDKIQHGKYHFHSYESNIMWPYLHVQSQKRREVCNKNTEETS